MIKFVLTVLVFLMPHQVLAAADMEIPDVLRSQIPLPEVEAKSWMLYDHDSGWIIGANEPDKQIEPASLSKLMTAYVVFSRLDQGAIALNDQVLVSEKAWRTGGSRMFIRVGTNVSVEELLKGLIVQSGNDAAVALAEHVAGSVDGFVDMMNQTAISIGMVNSLFANPTGLTEDNNYTTARDLTTLASAIVRDFPDMYRYYSIKEFTYNEITQRNRNMLLFRDDSVDGFKTGHTSSAGYNLIGSANREGRRLIATVVGTKSPRYRANIVYSLLQHGYAAYEGSRVYTVEDTVISPRLYKGESESLDVGVASDLYLIAPRGRARELKAKIDLDTPIVAPVAAGDTVGRLIVSTNGDELARYALVAKTDVGEGSWFGGLLDSFWLLFE